MKEKFIVSSSPHIYRGDSVPKIMWSVVAALIPAGVAAVVIFGIPALRIIGISVLSAVLCEWVILLFKREGLRIRDGSAVITGLLLAYNLPSGVPFWIPIVGAFFAIGIVKQTFGGLGKNIFNPALAARAFLLFSWPQYLTVFPRPFCPDAVTSATPLMLLKEGKAEGLADMGISYLDLFIGNRGGSLGEVCIVALLLGALFLLFKGYISWHTPLSFIVSFGVLSWIFLGDRIFSGDWLFHILSGGLILGAFFMATDYVTSPLTRKGQIIFGVGCGLLAAIIRKWGGYPEGVSFSILIMNAAVPIIDRYTKPRIFGR